MVLHGAFRLSCVLVLLSFAASQRKSQTGSASHHDMWSGYSRGDSGSVGSSSMSAGGKFPANNQDAELDRFVSNTWRLRPNRPFPQMAWTSDQVPLGMVAQRPLYPSSYVVKTSNGYQRMRDSSTDSKYSQDTFDHIPLPEPHKNPGRKI